MKMVRMSDVTKALGFSKSKVYKMIDDGEFMPGYGEGRYRRWHEMEIKAYQIFLWDLPDELPSLEQTLLKKIKKMAEKTKKKMLLEEHA